MLYREVAERKSKPVEIKIEFLEFLHLWNYILGKTISRQTINTV
jgi:hypothetical protein